MSDENLPFFRRDSYTSQSRQWAVAQQSDGTVADIVVIASWLPAQGQLIDHSGTIAAGGFAQEVMPANPSRAYFFFQNLSDTDMWINFGVEAINDSPSLWVPSGQAFPMGESFIPTQSVSVFCAATSKKFTAKEGQGQ